MDLRACSRCGKIHARGYKCNVGRQYQNTEERRLRNLNAWHKKAAQIKEDAFNLCEVCKAQGIYTYNGLEVHHIIKLSQDHDGLLDDDNLITLCVYHHKLADAGQIDIDYLRQLAKERGKNGNV